MTKKILIIPSWYPSEKDPISGIFIQEQAVALSKQYDVAVLVPGMAAWRNVIDKNSRERSVKKQQEGLPVYLEYALPLIPHGPESIDYDTFRRAVEKGFRRIVLEWGRPDLIHAHVVLPAGWSALKVAKRHGIPCVLTEHSSPFSMHLRTELSRKLVRETLTGFDRLIAISPSLAKQVLDFEPGLRIAVIGESVRTDFFVPGNDACRTNGIGKSFFVAARLSEQKGLEHLIKAVHLLKVKGLTSFEVVIGGGGPDRQKLDRLARDLGVADQCRFLGALNREQVRHQMQLCDVFVLSSLHETFGVVVGEAMSCGIPVISTRCGGPEFIVTEDNGILVDVADAQALAGAMADFIADRVRFNSKTVRASVVNRFSPEMFVKNATNVYEELW